MRVLSFLATLATFGTLVRSAEVVVETTQEVVEDTGLRITTTWRDENPFGHVVNGEKNTVTLTVENKSKQNITLLGVTGSVHHPETDALVKNLSTSTYGIELIENVKLQIPYAFYSEFKPGDVRLTIYVDHSVDGEKVRTSAYDSIVTIVEPQASIFDFKMISTYAVVASILGGLAYFAYLTFVPQAKKTRGKKTSPASVSTPIGTVTATGAGGYQEEWIPEHHLRKGKGKKSGALSGTSGDELSGGEISGTESRRRKSRK